jgi:D-alanyl-lipoteichoic acid acyltransferase DltB (MBOAT superfamily)
MHKIVSRVYGVLAILFGLLTALLGALALAARSTGSTYWDIIEKPAAVPALFAPYAIILSLIFVVLGIAIFRQSSLAAVCLLIVNMASDALSYLVPTLNVDGVTSFDNVDLAVDVMVVVLTVLMLITGRAKPQAQAA